LQDFEAATLAPPPKACVIMLTELLSACTLQQATSLEDATMLLGYCQRVLKLLAPTSPEYNALIQHGLPQVLARTFGRSFEVAYSNPVTELDPFATAARALMKVSVEAMASIIEVRETCKSHFQHLLARLLLALKEPSVAFTTRLAISRLALTISSGLPKPERMLLLRSQKLTVSSMSQFLLGIRDAGGLSWRILTRVLQHFCVWSS
jgi:hypothetical protein